MTIPLARSISQLRFGTDFMQPSSADDAHKGWAIGKQVHHSSIARIHDHAFNCCRNFPWPFTSRCQLPTKQRERAFTLVTVDYTKPSRESRRGPRSDP
jgi:hypothetical protein